MTPVVRLAPGQVIAQVPPMIPAPRVNVVQVPPPAPHILAPRPPPVVVPAGKLSPWLGILLKLFQLGGDIS